MKDTVIEKLFGGKLAVRGQMISADVHKEKYAD